MDLLILLGLLLWFSFPAARAVQLSPCLLTLAITFYALSAPTHALAMVDEILPRCLLELYYDRIMLPPPVTYSLQRCHHCG